MCDKSVKFIQPHRSQICLEGLQSHTIYEIDLYSQILDSDKEKLFPKRGKIVRSLKKSYNGGIPFPDTRAIDLESTE